MDLSRIKSQYEVQRDENIRKNEEYLKALGFDAATKKKKSVVVSKPKEKRKMKEEKEEEDEEDVNAHKNKRSKVIIEPVRRSRRLQNIPTEFPYFEEEKKATTNNNEDNEEENKQRSIEISVDVDGTLRLKITAAELQSFIHQTMPHHEDLISPKVIEHTAYRMSYMSNAKLATRLKSISRYSFIIMINLFQFFNDFYCLYIFSIIVDLENNRVKNY
jgi:hypothetical protein